jgi:macrolide transport system ATP-binding/permease protein
VPFTIIGVAPHDFTGTTLGRNVSVWIPLSSQQALGYKQHFTSRGGNPSAPFIWQENIAWLQIVGRISPGAKASSLLTSLNYIHLTSLHSTGEKVKEPAPLEIENGSRGFGSVRKRFSSPIFILMGAVGFVLLGTCANIATLMLVRGSSRSREISIRLSLGATHAQIARQFLADSMLLAFAGGLLGAAASPAFGRLLLWASWDFLPRSISGTILNTHVLLYCAAIVILTTLIFSTVPSLQSKTVPLTAGLRKEPVGSGYFGITRRLPMWFTRFFVVLQIGLSFVLLAEGAVFLRSLTEIDQTNVGFDKENTISVWFDSAAAGYTPEQMPSLYNRLSDALKNVPGVDSVAWSNCDIDSGCRNSSVIHFVAAPTVEGKVKKAQENRVSLDYFATLRIPLLDGRLFTTSDRIDSPRVAIVNKTFVRTYFEDGKAVGQRFGYDKVRNDDFQIVGVVNDVAVNGFKEAIPPMIYYPISQSGEPAQMLALHAPPTVTTKQVKEAIKQADNHLPITYVSRFSDLLDEDLTQDKGIMSLLSLFGILTVILSCLGTYGVISFLTKRRLPEFGVRLALGSSRKKILMLAFRDVFMVASAGVLLGIGGFLITFRLTSHFMTELHLPAIGLLLNLVVLLTGLALLSGSIPAWRASRTDPLVILRNS